MTNVQSVLRIKRPDRGVILTAVILVLIYALVFVLEQILSNALKYTKSGSIHIYLSPDAPKTLVIEDTGIGIAPEDLPRIFEKGYTGCNGRADKRSTGIGLYLCRQIMEKLSHTIRIESEMGVGTKVYLGLDTVSL